MTLPVVIGPLAPAPYVPIPAGRCGCDGEAQSCRYCDGEVDQHRRRPDDWPAETTPPCMQRSSA